MMPKLTKRRTIAQAAAKKRWQKPPLSTSRAEQPVLVVSSPISSPSLSEQPDRTPHSLAQSISAAATNQPSSSTINETLSSNSDSDFSPDEALKQDPDALLEEYVMDWVNSLPREDVYSLCLLLFHVLKQDFQLLIGPASKIIARHVPKNFKTIQKWRKDFLKNDGDLPEYLRGKHFRSNAISNNEELTKQAKLYVHQNSLKKGSPNLTARSFCSWVNDELLPNSTLEPGAPRKISVEVARQWLHKMGFKPSRITKDKEVLRAQCIEHH